MKLKLLMVICILLIGLSLFKLQPSFSSEDVIYYDASTNKFIYYNKDNNDLFNDFKNLMPGDIKEQSIKIKVINSNNTVNMYMKINYPENNDIINNLNINVYTNNNEINEDNGIYKISSGEDIDLKVKLELPVSLGNEIENYNNIFKMSFYVENGDNLVEIPKTYDNVFIYFILLFISTVTLFVLIIMLRRSKTKS